MKLVIKKIDKVIMVTLDEESLDAANVKVFKDTIVDLLAKNVNIVFQMKKVQFVDSSGLGAILSFFRKLCAQNGKLKLCEVNEPVKVLFELVHADKLLDIVENIEQAMDSFCQTAIAR